MKCRIFLVQLGLLFLWGSTGAAFNFEDVRDLAAAKAARPYEPPTNQVPEALRRLTYVEYMAIQSNARRTIWRDDDSPFGLQFFHPGYLFNNGVSIHEISDQKVRLIPFAADFFNYGTNRFEIPRDLKFAGFRVLQFSHDFGEVAAFLGASYFRMVGSGQAFGSSARGLALNTTVPNGEEFPAFEQFWIQRPQKNSRELTVFALLDSPSAAGAFQFIIRPGKDTVATVKACIFARQPVKEFGIAPLTSMFLHGENGRPVFADFRPEVHDADGLLIQDGQGEWIWHPLESGKMMRVNVFQDENPRGFGLMQRDRDFEHYQDGVAKFELRPSVWVRPLGKWGRGAVQLVQLPTDREYLDNIVAFWVPTQTPKPGESVNLEYEIHWTKAEVVPKNLGRVRDTRIGYVGGPIAQGKPNLRFVVDFEAGLLKSLPAKEKLSAQIRPDETVEVVTHSVAKNDLNGTWRLVIEIVAPRQAADLKASLVRNGQPLTETWTFTWQP